MHKDFVALIPNCHTWYSWGNEDTAKYDPGWKPYSNHTGKTRDIKYYDSWQYKTRQELDTYPFVGMDTICFPYWSGKCTYGLFGNVHSQLH